jgi:hypothetical protein
MIRELLVLPLFIVLFFSCSACRNSKTSAVEESVAGYTAVTVRNFTGMDGCSFVLVVNDSLRYEPVDLADSLKQDELQLWIRFKPVKDHMSICMAGTAIKITEARYRKK